MMQDSEHPSCKHLPHNCPSVLFSATMKPSTAAITTNSGNHSHWIRDHDHLLDCFRYRHLKPFMTLCCTCHTTAAICPWKRTWVLFCTLLSKEREEHCGLEADLRGGGRGLWLMCECDWQLNYRSGMFNTCYAEKILRKENSKKLFLPSSLSLSLTW